MKYRSRTEIVSVILEAANGGGATKTKIMYKAFLSYVQLKEYLELLSTNGLLSMDDSSDHKFRTTEKGLKFLKLYTQMGELALEKAV
jgi:predicted transcriptional regulator